MRKVEVEGHGGKKKEGTRRWEGKRKRWIGRVGRREGKGQEDRKEGGI